MQEGHNIPEYSISRPQFLRVEEVQKIMRISRAAAYNLARSKGFPTVRVGKRIIVPTDLFQRWVAQQAGFTFGEEVVNG